MVPATKTVATHRVEPSASRYPTRKSRLACWDLVQVPGIVRGVPTVKLRCRRPRLGDEPRAERAFAKDRADAEQPRRQPIVDLDGVYPFRGQRSR
jgi:hypothetical protein